MSLPVLFGGVLRELLGDTSWAVVVMTLAAVLVAGSFFLLIFRDPVSPKRSKHREMALAFPLESLMLMIEDAVPENTGNMTRYLTAVYIAAVQEYICAEILELSGRATGYADANLRNDRESTYETPIGLHHITKAINQDPELAATFPSEQQVDSNTGSDRASLAQTERQREMGEFAVSLVLRQIFPKASIDQLAKARLNELCIGVAKRILTRAVQRTAEDRKSTGEFKTVAVQQSVRETLIGELSKHAISEGTKYLCHFTRNGNCILQPNPESRTEHLRWPQDFLCID
eukprot:jgi/Bigna1/89316/estExt_fgenesh1_pg.C_470030